MNGEDMGDIRRRPEPKNAYADRVQSVGEEGKEKESIKETIEDLKKASITHRNAKEYFEMVKNKNMMAETSISNILNRLDRTREDLQSLLNTKQIKEMMETDQIVPIRVFEIFSDMYRMVDEMLIFRTLQITMFKILNVKLVDSLMAVKALDIEREVTQGLREIQGEYMNMIKQIVNDRFVIMDKKLETVQQIQKQDMNSFETNVYAKLIKDYEKINNANILALKELTSEFNERLDILYAQEKEKSGTAIAKPTPVREIRRPLASVIDLDEELSKIPKTRTYMPPAPTKPEEVEMPEEDPEFKEADEEDYEDYSDEDDEVVQTTNKVRCGTCGSEFNNQPALDVHIDFAHPEKKPKGKK